MTYTDIEKLLRQAASKAMVGWDTDLELDELAHELWSWYLSSPAIRLTLSELARGEAINYARRQAVNILSGEAKKKDLFDSRSTYSSESVKDALLGKSRNRYLLDIMPTAMRSLDKGNSRYAEAVRSRYSDDIIPPQGSEHVRLVRALRSLTQHVNIIALTAGVDSTGRISQGPGSKSAVFPDSRRGKGNGHSDPTANMALALIAHPELRNEYLFELPLRLFLEGRGACTT